MRPITNLLLTSTILVAILIGCTSLPARDEFLALECKEQTALLYDYAKENRRWAIAGTVLGAGGVVVGVWAEVTANGIAQGLKAAGP